MIDPAASHPGPLRLKYLTPDAVRLALSADPRLIVPVGTTEQHGPHLPLGGDTLIVDRLADDLSAEFRILRAPTIEYGVNAPTAAPYPGNATVRRKTLHRFLNDLLGSWEEGGVEQFIILTAHGHDPHQEAISTLHTRHARVRAVDIFAFPLGGVDEDDPIHGGAIDTSLLMYVAADYVEQERARDVMPRRTTARRLGRKTIPVESPGSVARPSTATVERGAQLYRLVYERIATRVLAE